ncbi:MAG: hypothetical protein EZS28_055876, partial [Streblomastix strix]
YQPDFCTCTSAVHPDNEQGCVCDEHENATFNLDQCRATKLCNEGTFINPTPTGCTPPDCTSASQTYKCNCKPYLDPIGCNCPAEPQQLVGIRTDACPCNGTDDPRRGITCEITRSGKSGVYNLTTCLATKTCTGGDFDNPSPTG